MIDICPVIWPRAIILMDMNAFFASVEQRDFPELKGKPLAIINGHQGSCIITCSYEARRYGVKTGMRLRDGIERCPGLIARAGRPEAYSAVSRAIMNALQEITPDIEVFSVDEAFLDVTACQRLFGTPIKIGKKLKALVHDVSGLPCSIGISGDKTTAKYAAKCKKPDGFTVIPPWESKQRLSAVPVTELCGIGNGIGHFLARYGVLQCGDIAKIPVSVLSKQFGNLGRRIWFMCQGSDPDPVKTEISDPKTMGHGKVMPPNTCDRNLIEMYFLHLCEKLAARMRRHDFAAQHYFIGLREYTIGWIGGKVKANSFTNDAKQIYQLVDKILSTAWKGEGISQVQVTALDPRPVGLQGDFFELPEIDRDTLNETVDDINYRYGSGTILPARLLKNSISPNVIAPAWKPVGHRQSIDTIPVAFEF